MELLMGILGERREKFFMFNDVSQG